MGSMAQTGLLLVPSDALGHTWALPGVLGAGQGLPPETGMEDLKTASCRSLGRGVVETGEGGPSAPNHRPTEVGRFHAFPDRPVGGRPLV